MPATARSPVVCLLDVDNTRKSALPELARRAGAFPCVAFHGHLAQLALSLVGSIFEQLSEVWVPTRFAGCARAAAERTPLASVMAVGRDPLGNDEPSMRAASLSRFLPGKPYVPFIRTEHRSRRPGQRRQQ